MKRTKISGFLLILTIMAIGLLSVEAQTSQKKTWKITVSQSGGYAGIMKSYTFDNDGNLNRTNKDQRNFEKIDEAKTNEIGKLVKELGLPLTKLKIFKGKRIYDGIYSGIVINLDGKDYAVEGTSFDDAKYLALSKKQKTTLEKLKLKLNEIQGFLPDAMTNKMD
jgi:hypothetical protein